MHPNRKLRMTHQRRVILEEVKRLKTHPTADEIYDRVRQRLPRVSLGTVYRNLDLLAACGLITRLEPVHPQMRFDGNTDLHYHLTCQQCGRVEDKDIEGAGDSFEALQKALGNLTKYGIFGHRLEFFGLCSQCRSGAGKESGDRAQGEEAASLPEQGGES